MKKALLYLYWMAIRLKSKLLRLFYPKGKDILLDINGIGLWVDALDESAKAYKNQFAEVESRLYPLIQKELNPAVALDIGANYGFISAIMGQCFTNAKIISVEPDQRTCRYIWKNIEELHNGLLIYNHMCGDKVESEHDFFINPKGSLDNRVSPDGSWNNQKTDVVTIDYLIENKTVPAFIKSDTQGYEHRVMLGGREFLSTNKHWLMKIEFAPYLLKHHGTDPLKHLRYLVSRYEVTELPSIIPFHTESIQDLFLRPLKAESLQDFILHIENRKPKQRGWCDLLIRP